MTDCLKSAIRHDLICHGILVAGSVHVPQNSEILQLTLRRVVGAQFKKLQVPIKLSHVDFLKYLTVLY